ncbi:colanic acid/amylovoran biosynthesis glycosyltransferase [Flavobacteriaceae bacterium MAR_2010_188]|nr:colanic acid/amylovoran biosynthesis glycosyltransferase [Flavobacteriaceae bacterium MAR_2010_188]
MKIGIVLSRTPSYSETFFNSKIKGLIKSGHEVFLFVQYAEPDFKLCPTKIAPQLSKRNPILQLKSFLRVGWVMARNIQKIKKFINLEREVNRSWSQIFKNIFNNAHILNTKVDWLHFGFATQAIQSENVAAAIGAKMGVSLRGYDMDVYPLKHKRPYDLLWKKVDKVHAISNYMMQRAYQEGLSANKNFQIITPAIEVAQFEFNKSKNWEQPKFLTIGRLHWIKGLQYTLEALAILAKKGIDFTYTIVGAGAEQEELLYTVHQLSLENHVYFVGKKSHEETMRYLSEANIYLQYSLSEGFCNAVLEAQASGAFCIVSDGGALAENILHGKTGMVLPKRNPMALAQMIEEVLDLPISKIEEIVATARNRIKNDFDLKSQEKSFSSFFEN